MKCKKCGKEFDDKISQGICPYCGNDNTIEKVKPTNPKWLQKGTLLQNRYEILEAIGDGGFGVTYKAFDHKNERYHAIKEYFQSNVCNRIPGTTNVLIAAPSFKEEYEFGVNRLLQESKTVARFTSPSIVRINDFFRENNTSYMVMEYLPFDDLRNIYNKKIVLSVKELVQIGIKICEALEEIHESGVIHRDISPDNIIITDNNEIKLIDFGSARLSKDDFDNSLLTFKEGFSPWEQYNPNDPKNDLHKEWTDVYALGATLYYLFTGVQPVASTLRKQALDLNQGEDPVKYPNTINKNIPENISNAIMKAMAVNIHERFQNATDFKLALKGEKKVEKVEITRSKKKKIRLVSIVAGFLIGACLAGYGYKIYKDKEKNFEFMPKATVSIWYQIDENSNDDLAKKKMLEDIRTELLSSDQYKDVAIELTGYNQDEYVVKLEEASKQGMMPTIFEVIEEGAYMNSLEDISDVTKSLKDKCTLVDQFAKNTISTGVNIPVVYLNYMVLDNPDEEVQFHFSSIADLEEYTELTNIAYNLNDEEILSASLSGFDQSKAGMKTNVEEFIDDHALIYLSDTSENGLILSINAAQYTMIPLSTKEQYCKFTDRWAMSETDGAEEIDGKAILKYMMTNKAQTIGYIEDGRIGIPLEKTTLQEFQNNRSTYKNFVFEFDRYKVKQEEMK